MRQFLYLSERIPPTIIGLINHLFLALVKRIRHMRSVLPDPDPLVRGIDPDSDSDPDSDPDSVTHLNNVSREEPSGAPEDPFQQAVVTAAHQLDDVT
jgi:hypothetical protein